MVKNFLFHRVSQQRDVLWDPMGIELFDKCIKYISNKYQVITIEDFTEKLEDKNYATISFDDGYKDNIEYALPILKKYNVKASFYVVTDCIDKNIPTWTYILDFLFSKTTRSKIELDFDFLPNDLKKCTFLNHHDKIAFVKKLKPILKVVAHEQRKLVLDKVTELFNDMQIPELMMDWHDLIKLRDLGHNIGSHTVSHCMLGTMSNEDEIRNELENSAKRIRDELGFFPKTISYPVGSYNQTTINISKKVGYEIGLAVKQNVYFPKKNNIFEVPRIELYNESWFKTWLRITHVLENLKKIIRYR